MTNSRTLLVTGASSDVGIALIKKVGFNYDKIIAHYFHSADRLNALNAELENKIIPLQADFSDEANTNAMIETIKARELFPDHIVHLAALPLQNVKFQKTSWTDYEKEIETSLRSAVMITRAFVPNMAKQKSGKIVFMLSFNVINQPPIKYALPYTTAKYALLGFMKGLSAEYAEKGVMVNAVSPSMIETKFLSNVPPLIIEKNAAESPLKRNLTVEDVLPALSFLLSDGADCITGQNIAVTGGN